MSKYCEHCGEDKEMEWRGYAAGENLFSCKDCGTCRSDRTVGESLRDITKEADDE
jgi:Zn-finger protein